MIDEWLSMIIIVTFNTNRVNIIWMHILCVPTCYNVLVVSTDSTIAWVKTILNCRLPISSNWDGHLKTKIQHFCTLRILFNNLIIIIQDTLIVK